VAEDAPSILGTDPLDTGGGALDPAARPKRSRRLLVSGSVVLALAYLGLLVLVALEVDRSLGVLERQLSSDTVEVLAREHANLVVERSIETLRDRSPGARRRLNERIEDLTALSQVVTSLAVVDRTGRVVASDEPGPQPESPAVFGSPPQPRLARRATALLGGGEYVVLVPLVEGGELVGHLRVSLHSDRVATLYQQSRWRAVVPGALGLAAIGVLGALLHVRRSRRADRLRVPERSIPPRARAAGDDLARVLRHAGGANGELERARLQGARRGLDPRALARLLKVGVVLAGRDLRPEQVSARALELCGCADEASFRAAWRALEPVLRESLAGPPRKLDETRPLFVEVSPGRKVQAELHRLEGPGEECLVLLRDPRALEAVESDASLLRQLDGLGRAYRTLAHELRAPLGAVMLNLDLLQESSAGGRWTERGRRCVRVVHDELQRLHRSLFGIFAQTVPDAPPREFDLAGSLADLAALLAPQARRQSVELDLRVEQSPLPVRGYPDRLRQAFLNVAVNALEAMPGGGRLALEACRDGGRVRVALRDTGPGIPTAALPRVYDPDFTTKAGGNGIGLHVARSIVELHGGEIELESRPGDGTEVRVDLPLAGGASAREDGAGVRAAGAGTP